MKEMVKLLAIGIAVSACALAAPVTCGSQNFDNGGGVAPGTGVTLFCPTLDAGAGNHISSITLIRSGDAQTVVSGAPTVSIDWDAPFGVTGFGALSFLLTPMGGPGSAFNATPTSPISATVVDNFGQTVNLSNFVRSTLGGTVGNPSGSLLNSGAVLIVDYTTSPNVPEPNTMALLGSALVGIGLLARRR